MTQAYPLQWPEGWPRTAPARRTYNWQLKRATVDGARRHLYNQLRMLGARSIVLSTSVPLRNDGEFYATMRPENGEVGVAVYFRLRDKPMAMARDAFDNIAQNMRSLGLAVEHLRGLERHGGSQMMERAFTGFSQLPPPGGMSAPDVDWRSELGPFAEDMPNFEILALAEARYRNKAKSTHSDAGGSDGEMIRLNLAIAQARKELQ